MAHDRSYAQFCPIAFAAEILAVRWMPLVLRELILGSTRFSEIRRGVPLMSPSLLSQRLKELERAGVLQRIERRKRDTEYRLTTAGHELRPVIELIGVWGNRFARSRYHDRDYDPAFLMWDVRRSIAPANIPAGRTVARFELRRVADKKRLWWLILEREQADLCLKDPGFDVDLYVTADIRALAMVWDGKVALDDALRSGALELDGSRPAIKAFRRWFTFSGVVALERAWPRGITSILDRGREAHT